MENQNQEPTMVEEPKDRKKIYYILVILAILILLVLLLFLVPRCQWTTNETAENSSETNQSITNQSTVNPEEASGVGVGINTSPSAMKPGMYSTIKVRVSNYGDDDLEIKSLTLEYWLTPSGGSEKLVDTEEIDSSSNTWKLDGSTLTSNEKAEVYQIDKTLNDLGAWRIVVKADTSRGSKTVDGKIEVRN